MLSKAEDRGASIPGPKPYPVVGNLPEFKAGESIPRLLELYYLHASLETLRAGIKDALFTAHHGEPNWAIAHRVLTPIFGPLKIREMFDNMYDIAQQLCLKWARFDQAIDITADFTRLTLDTIALCSMDYRFNSFYSGNDMHPFVESMIRWLREADKKSMLPGFIDSMRWHTNKVWIKQFESMKKTSREIIEYRRKHPDDTNDLLTALLNGRDPKTGLGLDDETIVNNLITFLIAGHETTSGLLSFTFYYMLKTPGVYAAAQKEVDDMIGSDGLRVEHVSKLPYIESMLRETLRIMPTAPAFAVTPKKDETIGGKYKVSKGQSILIFLPAVHTDEAVWGKDAKEFRPERMMDINFKDLPSNSWKPFGNGARGCIGRGFAWQEAVLVMALLLKSFDIRLDDPSYTLRIKETLTIKPDGFRIRVSPRKGLKPTYLAMSLISSGDSIKFQNGFHSAPASQLSGGDIGKSLCILYGSNQGTCDSLARRLAINARAHGFGTTNIDTLNSAKGTLPVDKPVVIITTSYDGNPTEDAAEFVSWLEQAAKQSGRLEKVTFAVFGCGNHDWNKTFHRIPKLVDELLEKAGAKRLCQLGITDVASDDIFATFQAWEESQLWPTLAGGESVHLPGPPSTTPEVEVLPPPRFLMRKNLLKGIVTETRSLSTTGDKVHLSVKLPEGTTYRSGDHMAVLPVTPNSVVRRALSRFHLIPDSMLSIHSEGSQGLPTSLPISASDLLGAYVDLCQPTSLQDIEALLKMASSDSEKSGLEKLKTSISNAETGSVSIKPSVLDILERFPTLDISIDKFLGMARPMRPRTYSISSSPNSRNLEATITWKVIDEASWDKSTRFLGICSNYLAGLRNGEGLFVNIHSAQPCWHPPDNPADSPMIMIGAGTGLAPFRGFLQDRMNLYKANKSLAPAILFFGCRRPDTDDLYRIELDEMERAGIVSVFRAYSRATDSSEAKGARYVQDRVALEAAKVLELWRHGARIYICGSRPMANSIKVTLGKILCLTADHEKFGSAENWFDQLPRERFVSEIF
ncbi:hypothetical protein B7463_g7315, partial [Scytalidium lignicola]